MYLESVTSEQLSGGDSSNQCNVRITWSFDQHRTDFVQVSIIPYGQSAKQLLKIIPISNHAPTTFDYKLPSNFPTDIFIAPSLKDSDGSPAQQLPDENGEPQYFETFMLSTQFVPADQNQTPPPEYNFCKLPPVPSIVYVAPGIFDLKWDEQEDYDRYDVHYQIGAGEPVVLTKQSPKINPIRLTKLLDGQTLSVQVRGYHQWYGGSCYSNWRADKTTVSYDQAYHPPVFRNSSISLVSRDDKHQQAIVVDATGQCFRSTWIAKDGWSAWHHLGTPMLAPGAPVATLCRTDDRIELFAVGQDGVAYLAFYDPDKETWQPWQPLGDALFEPGTPLVAMSRNKHHMEVYGVGRDGQIHARWYYKEWKDWFILGGETFPSKSPIAAVARNSDHMQIWSVRHDGVIRGNAWTEKGWHGWKSFNGPVFPQNASLIALASAKDEMTLCGVDQDGVLQARLFKKDKWHDWMQRGSPQTFPPGAPIAGVHGKHYVSIYAHTPDGRLVGIDVYLDGTSTFKELGDLAGRPTLGPQRQPVAAANAARLEVLGFDRASEIVTGVFNRNGAWAQDVLL